MRSQLCVCHGVYSGQQRANLAFDLDGSSFQKSQMFFPGSIWDLFLVIDLCSSAVVHCILRIHLFVNSKAGAYYTPLGMLQKNNVDRES